VVAELASSRAIIQVRLDVFTMLIYHTTRVESKINLNRL